MTDTAEDFHVVRCFAKLCIGNPINNSKSYWAYNSPSTSSKINSSGLIFDLQTTALVTDLLFSRHLLEVINNNLSQNKIVTGGNSQCGPLNLNFLMKPEVKFMVTFICVANLWAQNNMMNIVKNHNKYKQIEWIIILTYI